MPLTTYAQLYTWVHVCSCNVCTPTYEGTPGDAECQGGGGGRAPLRSPACVMWFGARMRFHCVCRTGGEGDKGAIVSHCQLEPSSPLTSQLP